MEKQNRVNLEILLSGFKFLEEQQSTLIGTQQHEAKMIFNIIYKQSKRLAKVLEKYIEEDSLYEQVDKFHEVANKIRKENGV